MASLYGNTCVLDALLIKPKRSQMSKGQAKQLDRVRVSYGYTLILHLLGTYYNHDRMMKKEKLMQNM